MCIRNRMTKEQRDAYLAKKPDIIRVWKVITSEGYSEYALGSSPKLTISKILTAQHEKGEKANIDYKPGFHSFYTRAEARRWGGGTIKEFYIRKSWVTEIGATSPTRLRVYVSKKITIDNSLLEK